MKKEHGSDKLVEIMAKYGPSSPRPGGAWRPERPLKAAPSGVPSIDYAIGIGGVPRGTIIEIYGPPASGKALALDTPIPTPTGWTTMGDLRPGDQVFDETGTAYPVVAVHPVMLGNPCYKVTFTDGTSVVADGEHLWTTHTLAHFSHRENGRRRKWTTERTETITTTQLMATLKDGRGTLRHRIPLVAPLVGETADLPLDPYVFGLWLGDGDRYSCQIHTNRTEVGFLQTQLESVGLKTEVIAPQGNSASSMEACTLRFASYSRQVWWRPNHEGLCLCGCGETAPITTVTTAGRVRGYPAQFISGHDARPHATLPEPILVTETMNQNQAHVALSQMGVRGNKHIPPIYLRASIQQRLALLQGLMDSDGHIDNQGHGEWTTAQSKLRDGMLELLRSLGYKPGVSVKYVVPSPKSHAALHGDKERYGPYWRIYFNASADRPPVRLPHKARRLRSRDLPDRRVLRVEKVPSVPVRCITVNSPNQLYLAGEGMVPTHNTLSALVFAAYAQQHGGMVGYVDAEHRLQPTFAQLVQGLDLDTMYYSEPDGGEEALNQTKDFVGTGLYDVWVVDSVHGCVPKALRDKEIGAATMAELAKLMSGACQVLEPIVSSTNTVVIFVNHVKSIPGVQYGRDWSKPGGSALDYYASVQLRVQPFAIFPDAQGRKIGHSVRVKVENSKVAAPYASATYDIFYKEGVIKKKDHERNGQSVTPGIDIGSCWFSVCEEADLIVKDTSDRWVDLENGEILGKKRDVIEMLESDCALRTRAHDLVYGTYGSRTKKDAEAAVA